MLAFSLRRATRDVRHPLEQGATAGRKLGLVGIGGRIARFLGYRRLLVRRRSDRCRADRLGQNVVPIEHKLAGFIVLGQFEHVAFAGDIFMLGRRGRGNGQDRGRGSAGKAEHLCRLGHRPGFGFDSGGDNTNADLAFQAVVERRSPNNVGVGVDQFLDVAGGLVDFHQLHVLAAGDRDDHPLGALQADAVEQWVGNSLFGGFDRAIFARSFTGAHHRLAHFPHHRPDVGEVEVDQARHDHQIGDSADPLLEHLVGHLERFLEGRVGIGEAEQILVGDDDQRIDMLLEFFDSAVGRTAAARALERERLGHHSDRQYALVAGGLGDHRRRASAGAPAHSRGDEAHVRAFQRFFDVLERLFGGGAADFRPRSRAKPLRDLQPELDPAIGFRGVEGLRVGVGDDEIDPLDVALDHVCNRIAAGAADTDDADPRSKLVDFWPDEINAHG